jgi:hypothetical protein
MLKSPVSPYGRRLLLAALVLALVGRAAPADDRGRSRTRSNCLTRCTRR